MITFRWFASVPYTHAKRRRKEKMWQTAWFLILGNDSRSQCACRCRIKSYKSYDKCVISVSKYQIWLHAPHAIAQLQYKNGVYRNNANVTMEIYKYEFCTPCAVRFVSRLNKKVNARVLIVLHTGSDVKKSASKTWRWLELSISANICTFPPTR